MTVILVSHSMEDVARYVDRIIVMNKSRVMFDDAPKMVFRHYKELEEVGLAAPQITYIMQALKAKGYRLYLLSNAATRQPIYWARAEASKLMDGALISAEVKLLKPDPRIYRTFLHKFALRPEECVFIDDTPINVEGALYENMAGIVFNMDVAALAESLRSLGVEW